MPCVVKSMYETTAAKRVLQQARQKSNTVVKHAGKSNRDLMEEQSMYGRKQMVLRWIITTIIFTACVLSAPIARADYGEWTWISGADTFLQAGTYGIKGTPAAANVPGARYGSAAWTDSTGNFWLFGGYGLDSIGTENYLNDLWRYDPDNDMWTWMSGSDIAEQSGTYGTKGTPAAAQCAGRPIWKCRLDGQHRRRVALRRCRP